MTFRDRIKQNVAAVNEARSSCQANTDVCLSRSKREQKQIAEAAAVEFLSSNGFVFHRKAEQWIGPKGGIVAFPGAENRMVFYTPSEEVRKARRSAESQRHFDEYLSSRA